MEDGGYLDNDSHKSSNRLMLLLATIAALPIPISIAFYIFWNTVVNHPIEWGVLSTVILAIAAYFLQISWGKKMNKAEETKQITDENTSSSSSTQASISTMTQQAPIQPPQP
jgi:hypothetical protein